MSGRKNRKARSKAKSATTNNTGVASTAATSPTSVCSTPSQTSTQPSAVPKSAWGSSSQTSSEPSVIPKPTGGPPSQTSTESSTLPKSAWGSSSQTSSEPSVIPKPTGGPPSQTSTESSTLPKSAWGAPSQTSSQPSAIPKPTRSPPSQTSTESSTLPKPAWGSSSQTSSEASVIAKPTRGPPSQTSTESSTLPKPAWGPPSQTSSEPSVIPKPTRGPPSQTSTESSTLPKSACSPPSQTSFPAARSSSAFPTLNESKRNLSLDTAPTSTRDSRSQSVRQGNNRRIIYSAVPDTAVLTPVRRPDEGGSKGQAIMVYTNHFPVHIDDAIINQYDIDIAMIDRDGKERLARKDDRWNVIKSIVNDKKKNFPVVWYDEGKTLYSRELLPDFTEPILIKLGKGDEMKTFQLKILSLVRQEKIQKIFDFIQKKTIIRPRETVRTIEILFKQQARNELVSVRNQFYDRNQVLADLKDGRGMAKGFYQALFLTRSGPTLNINLTFTCFYMPLNFVDFACKYLRKNITTGFTGQELRLFRQLIRDLLIETNHTNQTIRYKLRGFGLPANQIMFTSGDHDEDAETASSVEKISVADYFATKYNKKLQYPDLPCIDGIRGTQKKANWLPMEMVTLVEWQRSLKPLDSTQRASVSQKSIIKPHERYDQIMTIVNNREFDKDSHLKELNIRVDTKEMLQIKARILAPPEIKYRRRQGQGDAVERVNCGKWRIGNWFYTTPEITKWGLIYFGSKPDARITATLDTLAYQLPELLRRNGFQIRSDLVPIMKPARKDDVTNTLSEASGNRWQLAIIVLNNTPDAVYNYIKELGHQRLGLMTQCISLASLENNIDTKLKMYVDNLSQKINGKLGGINGVINLKSALSRSSNEDVFMFIGADTTHSTCSTDRPSIAAVVGSRNPTNTLYAARLCEQYPKKGRCSVEIIKELDVMVADLLKVFARTCGNRLPNKLVFYRDGVDEGQYQKVLDNEVKKIKIACRSVYGNKPLPQLTFIVVKKRHNTRFFLYDGKQTTNVQAGTVIDQSITHPSQFDFYLCSQAAIMGTSRPTLYHVLHDEIGFSSDDIQQLTYWLCHTDMRCTKSVSIPAPVHYAHLAAYASRTLQFDDDHEEDNFDENNEDPASYTMEDIKTKLMVLDQKIADDMWFI